jgi:cytochrome c553
MRLFAPKLGTGKEQDFFFRRKRSKKTLMNWTSGDPNSRRIKSGSFLRLLALCVWLSATPALAAAPDGKTIFLHGNSNGAMPCAACHGMQAQGNAATGAPKLAGLPDGVIKTDLAQFADGEAGNATMQFIAQALSAQEIAAVAKYLSSLPK